MSKTVVWLVSFLCYSGSVFAQNLNSAFELAKANDPAFASALAERDALLINARVASTAYFPEMRFNASRSETESNVRRSLSLTQPLIDLARYASYQEAEPREVIADATFKKREFELQQKLFKVLLEYLRAKEGRSLNDAKLNALVQQATASSRLYELGSGTLTDVRDTEVRAEQAKAAGLVLETRIKAAERQWLAMTGGRIGVAPFVFALGDEQQALPVSSLEDYLKSGMVVNPQIALAKQSEIIANLSLLKARAAVAPTLNGVATYTESAGVSSRYLGLALSMPVQAGGYLQMSGAKAAENQAREKTREAEQTVRLEIERLREAVLSGNAELGIRKNAINAATLSVDATLRSYKGGVRTHTDLLNAIQALFQAKEEKINTLLTLADNWLNLQVTAALPPTEAFVTLDAFLFP